MLNKLTRGGKWLGLNKEILLMQISEEIDAVYGQNSR
jgi:hypothetical protein